MWLLMFILLGTLFTDQVRLLNQICHFLKEIYCFLQQTGFLFYHFYRTSRLFIHLLMSWIHRKCFWIDHLELYRLDFFGKLEYRKWSSPQIFVFYRSYGDLQADSASHKLTYWMNGCLAYFSSNWSTMEE